MSDISISELQAQLEEARRALRASEGRFRNIIERSPVGTLVVDADGVVQFVNAAAEAMLGCSAADLVGAPFGFPLVAHETVELDFLLTDGRTLVTEMRVAENEWEGKPVYLVTLCDVTRRAQMEQTLRETLRTAEQREREVSAMLKSARAVLEHRDFLPAARAIFDACKDVIGAASGYVALLTPDGSENEMLFLDSGGLPCTVDPELPMPIRGLRERAYATCQTVYENDFMGSEWVKLMPEGHVTLHNVLFAPLAIEGRAVGLLGLANKAGDFTAADAHMATAFGEIAAVALRNSRTLEALERSQQKLHNVITQSYDGIMLADEQGLVIEWNRAMEEITGLRAADVLGTPVWDAQFRLGFPEDRTPDQYERLKRMIQAAMISGQAPWLGKPMEREYLHSGGARRATESIVFPIKTERGFMLGSILRDVTERKETEEQLKAALRAKELLLREIHHRVKNNFSIISSLLDLQSENVADEHAREVMMEAQNRIQTMARIHEHLYRSDNLAQIDMAEYIKGLADYLHQSYGDPRVALRVDASGVALDIDAAIPCGLIINELVSNALKYAFSGADGQERPEIVVSMRPEDGEQLLLEVRDNGAGLPADIPLTGKRGSLGLKLVNLLTRQLRGALEVERAAPGAVFKLRFTPSRGDR